VLAGVAAALCGCGASSLSADELARRANAICARYQHVYRGGGAALHTRTAVVRYLDRTIPAAAREERELRALHPRRNEAAKVQRLLDHVRAARRILVQLRNADAVHDDATAVKVGRRLGVETRRTTKEARALGWTVCASALR
jgi:type II secretory pathway component PulM